MSYMTIPPVTPFTLPPPVTILLTGTISLVSAGTNWPLATYNAAKAGNYLVSGSAEFAMASTSSQMLLKITDGAAINYAIVTLNYPNASGAYTLSIPSTLITLSAPGNIVLAASVSVGTSNQVTGNSSFAQTWLTVWPMQ